MEVEGLLLNKAKPGVPPPVSKKFLKERLWETFYGFWNSYVHSGLGFLVWLMLRRKKTLESFIEVIHSQCDLKVLSKKLIALCCVLYDEVMNG